MSDHFNPTEMLRQIRRHIGERAFVLIVLAFVVGLFATLVGNDQSTGSNGSFWNSVAEQANWRGFAGLLLIAGLASAFDHVLSHRFNMKLMLGFFDGLVCGFLGSLIGGVGFAIRDPSNLLTRLMRCVGGGAPAGALFGMATAIFLPHTSVSKSQRLPFIILAAVFLFASGLVIKFVALEFPVCPGTGLTGGDFVTIVWAIVLLLCFWTCFGATRHAWRPAVASTSILLIIFVVSTLFLYFMPLIPFDDRGNPSDWRPCWDWRGPKDVPLEHRITVGILVLVVLVWAAFWNTVLIRKAIKAADLPDCA